MQTKNCFLFESLGICLNQNQCPNLHPNFKKSLKKSLKLNSNKFNQTIIKSIKCECCKDKPFNCKNSSICLKAQKCSCQLTYEEKQSYFYNCTCCLDDVFNCQNMLCQQLGICQCSLHEQMDEDIDINENQFMEKMKNCNCCYGYVFQCNGPNCDETCFCLMASQFM